MKVAILAGGLGTRFAEETEIRPKPMIEIGGMPILWHIMKHYYSYGHNEFVILCGYKSYFIKEFFANYALHRADVTISTKNNTMTFHNTESEDWHVTLVETGQETMTGGRILRAKKYLDGDSFMLTYGDGLSDVNLNQLIERHQKSDAMVTMTTVQPEGRFGVVEFGQADKVNAFSEKPKGDGAWINAGFFVCRPEVFKFIEDGDETIFERQPLEKLSREGRLSAYRHEGFWRCMDTLRDKQYLQGLWDSGTVPWKL
jgi:glucose-1-phosphate cytidylyltransferase